MGMEFWTRITSGNIYNPSSPRCDYVECQALAADAVRARIGHRTPCALWAPWPPLTPWGVGGGGGVGCPDEGVTESMASREFGGGTDILGET
jgi:hypothetical protein